MLQILLGLIPVAASNPLDLSGVKPGPVSIAPEGDAAVVRWKDRNDGAWQAKFNLDSAQPLIDSIIFDGKRIIERANPLYSCQQWRWACVAVWDIAGDGAFANPVWKSR